MIYLVWSDVQRMTGARHQMFPLHRCRGTQVQAAAYPLPWPPSDSTSSNLECNEKALWQNTMTMTKTIIYYITIDTSCRVLQFQFSIFATVNSIASVLKSVLISRCFSEWNTEYRCKILRTLSSNMTVGGNWETGSSWSPGTPIAPTQTLPQYIILYIQTSLPYFGVKLMLP